MTWWILFVKMFRRHAFKILNKLVQPSSRKLSRKKTKRADLQRSVSKEEAVSLSRIPISKEELQDLMSNLKNFNSFELKIVTTTFHLKVNND